MGQASKSSQDDGKKKKGLFYVVTLSESLQCRPEFSYSHVTQMFHFSNKASSWVQIVRASSQYWSQCLAHQDDGELRFLLSQSGYMDKFISCKEI